MSATRLVQIQFGTQVATHLSGTLTQELAENLFLEVPPKGAKSSYVLLGTPGLDAFATVGDGPIRGVYIMGDVAYVVSGGALYSVSKTGVVTLLGNIEGSALVSIADNGTHIWVATGLTLYAANISVILNVANGYGITSVTYQDGYLIGTQRGTQNLWISELDDATTIDAIDLTTVDTLPDNNIAVISDHREVWVFKERSSEAFYNSGAAAFPFERTQMIERGCFAAASVVKAENSIFWVGDDLQVYEMMGYQPQVISTHAVTRELQNDLSPSSAEGFIYQQDGHTHYALTLSAGTFVYDLSTRLWHKRKSYGLNRWRARSHAWSPSWNKHLIGDFNSGALYALNAKTFSEAGEPLIRKAVGSPIWNNGHRFIVDEFFLDIEAGVGLVTGQGSDPQVILDATSDGGRTYGSELRRSFGKIGEYQTRCHWHNLGGHYNWAPRITISDPVPVRILGAYARITRLSA